MPHHQKRARQVVTLYFPTGTEYHVAKKKPEVGQAMKRDGRKYVIVDVGKDREGNVAARLKPDPA